MRPNDGKTRPHNRFSMVRNSMTHHKARFVTVPFFVPSAEPLPFTPPGTPSGWVAG